VTWQFLSPLLSAPRLAHATDEILATTVTNICLNGSPPAKKLQRHGAVIDRSAPVSSA